MRSVSPNLFPLQKFYRTAIKVFIASIQTVSQVETISYENDSIHLQYCLMWLQMEDNEFLLFAESSKY